MPIGDFLKKWSAFTGKPAQYIQVDVEDYCVMYPKWGAEMIPILQFWQAYGDKSWSIEDHVTAKDLGIEAEVKSLEDAWREIDWSALD
jgi:hypothetical protein